jgi:hypothetical protein
MKSEYITLGEVIDKLLVDAINIVTALLIIIIISPFLIAMYIEDIQNVFIRRLLQCIEIIVVLLIIRYLIIRCNMVDKLQSFYDWLLTICGYVTLHDILYGFAIGAVVVSIIAICKYLGNLEVAHCTRKDE